MERLFQDRAMLNTIEKRESVYMKEIKEAMKKIQKLQVVPGMLKPSEYIRRFIEQNGISQREFNRMVGSHSTGFTNQVLSGKGTISDEMAEKIGWVIFKFGNDVKKFQTLVWIEKTPTDSKLKNKIFRTVIDY